MAALGFAMGGPLYRPLMQFVRSVAYRKMSIVSHVDIAHVASILSRSHARGNAHAYAPKTMVVTTAPKLWTDAVSELLPLADLVIIELSERSPSLEWELAQVAARCAQRALVIVKKGVTGEDASVQIPSSLSIVRYDDLEAIEAALREGLDRRMDAVG